MQCSMMCSAMACVSVVLYACLSDCLSVCLVSLELFIIHSRLVKEEARRERECKDKVKCPTAAAKADGRMRKRRRLKGHSQLAVLDDGADDGQCN